MPEDRGEPWDMFDKEDMSDMFSRAMLEKMQLVGEYITVFLLELETKAIRRFGKDSAL